MAHLGRRRPFKPIINRQISAPAVVALAPQPYVVSFAANQVRRRSFATIIKTLGLTTPAAASPLVVSQVSVNVRRQRPFAPIINTIIQPSPPVGRSLVVSRVPVSVRRQRPFSPIIQGLIQYAVAASPVAEKPLVVSQVAVQFRRPQILSPLIQGLIQYAQAAPPVADRPMVVSRTSVEFRTPQILSPIIRGLIQYQPDPVGKSLVVSRAAVDRRRQQLFLPIIKRQIAAVVAATFVAPRPFVVSQISVQEVVRRARMLFAPIINTLRTFPATSKAIGIVSRVSLDEAERRGRKLFRPIIKTLTTAPIPPPIGRSLVVSQTSVEFRRPQILSPIIKTIIKYAVAQPPVGKAYIVNVAKQTAPRFRGVYRPTMKRILPPAPSGSMARKPYIVGQTAKEEAQRRAHTLRKPLIAKPNVREVIAIADYLTARVKTYGVDLDYNFAFNNLQAARAPLVSDDASLGYAPGSVWIDKTGQAAYICIRASLGAAVWEEAQGGGSTFELTWVTAVP